MNYKEFFQSKIFKRILYGIGAVILALVLFQAGLFVGYHKARFSYGLGDNYYQTFGRPRESFMGMSHGGLSEASGVVGKILKISLPTLVVEGRDNIEKIVRVTNDTTIRKFRETVPPTDLKVDDFVVIIGSPNEKAEVEAKLIRLMPSPADMMMGSSTKSK